MNDQPQALAPELADRSQLTSALTLSAEEARRLAAFYSKLAENLDVIRASVEVTK